MKNDFKILHISTDEKFINGAEYIFNQAFPNRNSFLIIKKKPAERLNHISSSIQKLKVIGFKDYQIAFEEIKQFELIVIHGLPYIACKLVANNLSDKKFLWCFWGGEIYDNPEGLYKGTIGALTSGKTLSIRIKSMSKEHIKWWLYKVKGKMPINNIRVKAAKKIEYFGALHKEDFEYLISSNVLSKNANFIPFTYYPIEFLFKGIEDCSIKSDDILIGNSASISNNHLEAFGILKKLNITNKKIVTPLSYGDKKYADLVVREGNRQFGKYFEPLINFMPLQDYNLLLQKCGFVIMNHYRQQAVGNIITMLWLGAKVFLDERNTFYHYLKRLGVHVFSIETDLKRANGNPFTALRQEQITENRNLLFSELNTKVVVDRLRKGINSIR